MESLLDAYFLNVGQGDSCVLLHLPTRSALIIDCPSGRSLVVRECLKRCHQSQVLSAVITHFDFDHAAGIVELIQETFSEGTIRKLLYAGRPILSEAQTKKRRYRHTLDVLAEFIDKGLEFVSIFSGDKIWVEGNLHVTALHPSLGDAIRFEAKSDTNNSSLILMIAFGSNRILLAGDLESQGWEMIFARQPDLKAQILKFPHHGAWNNLGNPNDENCLGRRIIKAIEPEIVIFSVGTGKGTTYQHPNPDSVLGVLNHNPKARIICTQGTARCGQNLPAMEQVSAIMPDGCRIGNGFGSEIACAGTIIVRFDERNYSVEPTIAVHDKAINLYQAPMCRMLRKS